MITRPPALHYGSSKSLLTLHKLSRILASERITSVELASFCHSMAVAGETIWNLNAFSRLTNRDELLFQADICDQRRRQQQQQQNSSQSIKSILDGIPISFKANIAIQTQPLTAGSRILGEQMNYSTSSSDFSSPLQSSPPPPPPCGYDADVVRTLLEDKGAICVGVTNMDEFGMGSLGTHLVMDDNDGRTNSQEYNQSSSYSRATLNPLPFLQHLRWEDAFSNNSKSGSWNTNSHITSDEEFLTNILSLPHDAIEEVHERALERLQTSQVNGDDTKEHHEMSTVNGIQDESYLFSAGGSSCGSACSVAHGSSVLSLGTDTGGSIRLPASWCGIVGLKPTYGLLSRFGIVSYASSFDTVGILSNTVDCATTALDALAQRSIDSETSFYSRDPTSTAYEYNTSESNDPANYTSGSPAIAAAELLLAEENDPSKMLDGVKVGIPASFVFDECPDDVIRTWSRSAEWLEDHGAHIVEVSTTDLSLDLVQLALSSYYVLVSAEASSNLSRYDGFRYGVAANQVMEDETMLDANSNMTPLEIQYATNRSYGFGSEVTRRILCGTSVLSSDRFHTHYEAAAKIRAQLAEQLTTLMDESIDLLLIPTVASSTPQRLDSDTPIDSTAVLATDVFTVPASLAGLPAMSVPVHNKSSDPFHVGMQFIGSRLQEDIMLKVASVLEGMEDDCL